MAFTDDIFVDRDFRFATVVDRLGVGKPVRLTDGRFLLNEFFFNGETKLLGVETQLRGPEVIHLFRNDKLRIHITDADGNLQFVHRYGIKDGPADLLAEIGLTEEDNLPIPMEQVELSRIEHWDSESADPERAKATVKRTPVTTSMRGRDGIPGTRTGFTGR